MPAYVTSDNTACAAERLAAAQAAGCRRAGRCAARVARHDPDGRLLGHAGADPVTPGICEACTRDVGAAVRGLGYDLAELHLALGRTGRSPSDWLTTRVSASPAPPVPIALGLDALGCELVEDATRWAEIVADVYRVPGPPNRFAAARPGVALGRAVRLLSSALPQLLALGPQPVMLRAADGATTLAELDGVDGALSLLGLHERVARACGRAELVHHLGAPCPRCDRQTLVRHNGGDEVRCSYCHHTVEEDHYDWLVRVLADEQRSRHPDLARTIAA